MSSGNSGHGFNFGWEFGMGEISHTVPSINYLPEKQKTSALYIKITEILDFIRWSSNENFINVKSKYLDPNVLDSDALSDVVNEFGFGYIVNVLTLDKDQLRSTLGFIALIHLLKGHRQGLELVLDLLGLSGKYTIYEWYEDTSLQPGEFVLSINLNAYLGGFSFVERLKVFVNEYVFPKMIIQDTSGLSGYGYGYGYYYGGIS